MNIFHPKKLTLGEGLYTASGHQAWVDIETRLIYWNGLEYFLANYIPTVIFSISGDNALIGTDKGICKLNRSGEVDLLHRISGHDPKRFRLNDGCMLKSGSLLFGSMSKSNPSGEPGKIHRISTGGRQTCFDWPCHIPNSFVELSPTEVLISDSFTQTVYRCFIEGETFVPNEWCAFDSDKTPDGGTLLPDGNVAIALWDGACVVILDQQARLVQTLPVPAKRPTNCKYNRETNELIITTASIDLDEQDLANYPESGRTLSVTLR